MVLLTCLFITRYLALLLAFVGALYFVLLFREDNSFQDERNLLINTLDSAQGEVFKDATRRHLIKYLLQLPPFVFQSVLQASQQSLPLEKRPNPQGKKIIIASTWRSGTTFLNHVLASHPGTFNNYEPLHHFGIRSFYNDSDPESTKAMAFLEEVLSCRYIDDAYLDNLQIFKSLSQQNLQLWDICKENFKELCYRKEFLEASCALFPIMVMKTVRIGLAMLKPALQKFSNLHVIYLVRDPRAVIHSRKVMSGQFCSTPDCNSTSVLCQHMNSDYKAFKEMSTEFKGRVHIIRYEDMSLLPYTTTDKLLKSLNLELNSKIKKFIKSHTTFSSSYAYSTFKRSSKKVTAWLSNIDLLTLTDVQDVCSDVMAKFGYKVIDIRKMINSSSVITNFTYNSIS